VTKFGLEKGNTAISSLGGFLLSFVANRQYIVTSDTHLHTSSSFRFLLYLSLLSFLELARGGKRMKGSGGYIKEAKEYRGTLPLFSSLFHTCTHTNNISVMLVFLVSPFVVAIGTIKLDD